MLRTTRVIALVAIAFLASSCGSEGAGNADAFRGAVFTPPKSVMHVTLPNASNGNKPFTTRAERGHLLLVYFGYTNCPDICPTSMADIRKSLKDPAMAEHQDKVDLAMVTVDPKRDTGDLLKGYVNSFHPGAEALRTDDPDKLAAAAKAFGASYSVIDPGHNLPMEVGHSAVTYGVDDRGKLIAQWAFGTPAVDLAHDFAMILEGVPLRTVEP